MIYLKMKDSSVVSYDFHAEIGQVSNVNMYHIGQTDLNSVVSSGLGVQEVSISAWVSSKNTIDWRNVAQISFDNSTWQDVLGYKINNWRTMPYDFYIPFQVSLLVSPLRVGAAHSVSSLWYGGSAVLTQNGNYKSYAKITYHAPSVFFPLSENLNDFAGKMIDYTAPARSYNGVSYDTNEPIFDEGLYFSGVENANFSISNTLSDYTILLKMVYKGGAYSGIILAFDGSSLYWDDATTLTLSSIGDYSVTFPQTDYEAGDPVLVIITHKSDGTGSFAVGTLNSDGTLSNVSTTTYTDTDLNDFTDEVDVGYDGGTDIINGHSLSDLVIYPYVVDSATSKTWHLTTEPLKFNDMYIQNVTAGMITFEDGKLMDEDGNDITYYVAGIIPSADPSLTISMTAGLSGYWDVEIKDVYVP